MKDNYEIAVDMLNERYERNHVMIDAHYAKMMNLPVATYKSTPLRSFYDITEKHLHCLHSLREDDNEIQILLMLKSKLPRNVLLEWEKMKTENKE